MARRLGIRSAGEVAHPLQAPPQVEERRATRRRWARPTTFVLLVVLAIGAGALLGAGAGALVPRDHTTVPTATAIPNFAASHQPSPQP